MAAAKVFAVPELLEAILSDSDIDARSLFVLQRINSTFRDTILDSPTLTRKMNLRRHAPLTASEPSRDRDIFTLASGFVKLKQLRLSSFDYPGCKGDGRYPGRRCGRFHHRAVLPITPPPNSFNFTLTTGIRSVRTRDVDRGSLGLYNSTTTQTYDRTYSWSKILMTTQPLAYRVSVTIRVYNYSKFLGTYKEVVTVGKDEQATLGDLVTFLECIEGRSHQEHHHLATSGGGAMYDGFEEAKSQM